MRATPPTRARFFSPVASRKEEHRLSDTVSRSDWTLAARLASSVNRSSDQLLGSGRLSSRSQLILKESSIRGLPDDDDSEDSDDRYDHEDDDYDVVEDDDDDRFMRRKK